MIEILKVIQASDVTYRLGWTLLHSLWLGVGVAAVLALVLAALRNKGALLRYAAACTALALLLAAVGWTYCVIPARAQTQRTQTPAKAADNTPTAALSAVPTVASPAVPTGDLPTAPIVAKSASAEPVTRQEKGIEPAMVAPHTALPAAAVREPLAASAKEWLAPVIPWVVLVWAMGVLVLSVWQLSAWRASQRLCVAATRTVDAVIEDMAERLRGRLQISRPVKVMRSMLAQVPMTIGWVRPVILLPASLATGLSSKQLEMLLVHELAHIRRMDYLVNLVQTVIETLMFYHPAVWYIARRIRAERENCCDDVVVEVCGDRDEYAEALVACSGVAMPLAMAASTGGLLPRLQRILGMTPGGSARGGLWSAVAALLLVAGFVLIPLGASWTGQRAIASSPAPATASSTVPATAPRAPTASGGANGV